jgi:hypothetical protein
MGAKALELCKRARIEQDGGKLMALTAEIILLLDQEEAERNKGIVHSEILLDVKPAEPTACCTSSEFSR